MLLRRPDWRRPAACKFWWCRLPAKPAAKPIVTSVTAPAHLRQSEQFGLEVSIDSTVNQVVGVRVLAGSAVAYEGSLQLRVGTNPFVLPMTAGAPGFAQYRVQIIPLAANDTFYQNNELAAFSQIAGPPRVLLVKNPPAARRGGRVARVDRGPGRGQHPGGCGGPDRAALRAAGAVGVCLGHPGRCAGAGSHPAPDGAIQTYVRDLGGGLVAVGGPSGVSGWGAITRRRWRHAAGGDADQGPEAPAAADHGVYHRQVGQHVGDLGRRNQGGAGQRSGHSLARPAGPNRQGGRDRVRRQRLMGGADHQPGAARCHRQRHRHHPRQRRHRHPGRGAGGGAGAAGR